MSLVRTILLVGLREDEAEAISECLKNNHGCNVVRVSHCLEATERVRMATTTNPIHTIITQAKMAPMSGVALALQFRERGLVTPIILISDGTINNCILANASPYYLDKEASGKINITELMKIVHMTLYHPVETE